jgi:hypothetical protein
MSLDDLLDNKESTSAWRSQRKKLVRITVGLLVVTITLVAIAALLYFMRDDKPVVATAIQNEKAKMVGQLIGLQKETKDLQEEILNLRSAPIKRGRSRSRRIASVVPLSYPEVINFDPGKGFIALDTEREDLYIPTGAVFRARLITPIKTSVQRTFVIAETTNEYRMDMKRRIPKGSRLVGRSHLNPVLKGVIVEFETLVLPNGIETSISGLALSRNALPEIDGLYFSDELQTYGTALAFGFISGFADASRTRESTILGSVPEVSVNNQVLSGLSTASFQVAENILQDIRSRAVEYVVVPAGEPVFVALTKRYNLSQRSSNENKNKE